MGTIDDIRAAYQAARDHDLDEITWIEWRLYTAAERVLALLAIEEPA